MNAAHPEYVVTRTDAGADLNYHCPCGCYAGFALDRSVAEQPAESCCCGRTMLAGRGATERLRAVLPGEDYAFDEQIIEMPWGQPVGGGAGNAAGRGARFGRCACRRRCRHRPRPRVPHGHQPGDRCRLGE